MKPEKPITRKEMYLDVATGGSTELPSPVTREEKYLAKIAGESVDVPTPVTRYEMLLAAVAGESYTLTPVTRLEIYLAKAAGQDVEIPQPVTREEMYWFDYCGGTPTPPEREYTGAVPVTFVADGTPLLDYLISGNTVQSGTPTPDNPIMPQGTGERTGNLFDYATQAEDLEHHTAKQNFYLNSSGDEKALTSWWISDYIEINSDTVTVCQVGGNTPAICCYDSNKEYIRGQAYMTGGVQALDNITLNTSGAKYVRFSFYRPVSGRVLMLVEGSTAPTSYIPFGYKIPISSANTTTPIYLGEVETTRKIKKLVLTGEEEWLYGSAFNRFSVNVVDFVTFGLRLSPFLATHFSSCSDGRPLSEVPDNSVYSGTNNPTDVHTIYIKSTIFASINEWKAYLQQQYAAGTPVTVWYVLANEETAVVNEPLMRIGDYADTLSMEQAGAQIPTANGSTTLDVETAIKPSEVYIKYRGEAVATLSMLSAEVSSPEGTEEVNPEETEETENGSEDISLQHEFEAIE